MDSPGLLDEGQGDARKDTPKVVVLQHPSGSKVYLCATAHISAPSARDVETTIESVSPAIVVVELDPERMARLRAAADAGDLFGLRRFQTTGAMKIVGMALSGELLAYASGLLYVCTGALMGTRPGGEFLAAAEAAERVGATLAYGDRSQQVTMRRLQWYTQKLAEAERGAAGGARPGVIDFPTGGGIGDAGRDASGGRPTAFPSGSMDSGPSQQALKAKAEVEAAVGNQENPWGLEDIDDGSEGAIKARLLRMMREGGCPAPNTVLAAAQRLLRSGLDPRAPALDPGDVLEVRRCGSTLVETFRDRALRGDDSWMREFELESVTGAKGALGAQRSRAAMRKVILDERDVVLARRLWEAGEAAGGAPVVGVCGAGHVRGVQRLWDEAGTPEMAARADEYCRPPPGEGGSLIGAFFTGSVVAYLSWKRPKAAGFLVGAAVLASAPYLGFSVVSMRRLAGFAGKLAAASERIESAGDMTMAMEGEGWPQEGTGGWQ